LGRQEQGEEGKEKKTLEGTRGDEIFEGVDEKLLFVGASFFPRDSLLLLLAASARGKQTINGQSNE